MNGISAKSSGRRRLGRGGFTLVELLVTVSIVGILAGLAIPNMRNMTFRARATSVAGDLQVLRVAVLNYNGDSQAWPAETPSGTVPPELTGYLPDGFSFSGNGYELDFENIPLPLGLPGDPNASLLIGASVTAPDDRLSNGIAELLGGTIVFSVGNTHTVVINAS
ncbi:MAG: prepilin-type N-terminal cleavage/methylation domain-containing protein [Gemmatimonadetes bacterium]|nr:prepilin-type N-terminal cleavage/methylation domain-containing protein [Gemmatimonadota bacterium]